MAKYLDSNGLAYLWGKMKSYVDAVIQSVGAITGVKGDAESAYRTGNVNLTAANIGAAASSHTHAASDVASGTLDIGRIPTGTGASQVALGNHTHSYLPLSGGTMTGRLAFNDGTAMPNASTNTDFFAVGFQAFANGGGVWYKGLNDFKSWIGLSSYLALSGGTLTGFLGVKGASVYVQNTDSSFDRDGSNPSSALYGNGFAINDKDGERVGFIRANRLTDGTMQMQFAVANDNTSGTEVTNYLCLNINRSGTRTVSFAESAPWRTALGLDALFKTASASKAWSSNIAAGGTQNVTVTFTVPSGYTIAAIRRVSSGNANVDIAGYYISGSTVVVALHNATSSARSSNNGVTVDVLLAKSIFVG